MDVMCIIGQLFEEIRQIKDHMIRIEQKQGKLVNQLHTIINLIHSDIHTPSFFPTSFTTTVPISPSNTTVCFSSSSSNAPIFVSSSTFPFLFHL